MRRIALVFSMALGLAAPAFGQSPYPYYGPTPMPGYLPQPMMARPTPYPPAPMMMVPQQAMYAPQPVQRVMVLGPLDGPVMPQPRLPAAEANGEAPMPPLVHQTQGEQSILPVPSKKDLPPEACANEDCGDTCGPEGCGKIAWIFPVRGKGHFIGEVGAYFLAPFPASNAAYNSSNGAATDFAHQLDIGPRVALGYIAHTGWGVRGDYWFLNGSISTSTGNPAGSGVTVATPTEGPLTIVSPSGTLNQGVGIDQFNFTQRLELHVADIEAVNRFSVFDLNLLASLGARYTRINQGYTASRSNSGALDREDLSTASFFQGWGPTFSLEAVHPIACGFALYGSLRSSFLFGTQRFSQDYSQQTALTGVNTSSVNYDARVVSIVEAEAGLQYGCTICRHYYFARVGAVYQRWWDVGSATSSSGDLTLVGGTIRLGVSY